MFLEGVKKGHIKSYNAKTFCLSCTVYHIGSVPGLKRRVSAALCQ